VIGFSAGGAVINYVLLNTDKRGYEPVDEHDKASSRLDWGVFIYSAGGLAGKDGKNNNDGKDKIILTVQDFEELAALESLVVERRYFLAGHRKVEFLPNLLAEVAVFLVTRHDPGPQSARPRQP
jgi:hypothetical protein